ncbi:MAG: L-lactate permease [Rhodospirillales bacterium]|nr:MAG: L-lactate permease [Rhodospirillales bacterium]
MTLFLLSLMPFVILFVMLIPLRRPAYEAAPVAYIITLTLALVVWQVSSAAVMASLLNALIVFVEVLLIISVALLLLNVLIETGTLKTIRTAIANITADERVVAMLLAWGLVCFIEGIAGFGTPAVLAAPVLVYFGLAPLKAVTISLVGNGAAVPFGAAGTPVIIGFAGLGLSEEVVASAVFQAALVHGTMSVFITCFIAYVVTLGEERGRFKTFVPFAILSALAFSIPYVLIAFFVGPELPSILGGIIAIVTIACAAHKGFLLPPETRSSESAIISLGTMVKSFVPFGVMAVALIVSRTMPALREALGDLTISFGEFRGIDLDQELSPLYTPYFYLALALITAIPLFKVSRATLARAAAATYQRVRVAAIILIFIIAITQLLVMSEVNHANLPSMPQVLAGGFASFLGEGFVVFSAFLGALGSFMTGSATVSNLLFAGLQVDVAQALERSTASLLALQLAGAGIGAMISLHNVAMAAGAAGLEAREGQVIRETIIPVLVVCSAAGIMLLFW